MFAPTSLTALAGCHGHAVGITTILAAVCGAARRGVDATEHMSINKVVLYYIVLVVVVAIMSVLVVNLVRRIKI